MNLNPFQTITIKCPLSIEEAWEKLRKVTQEPKWPQGGTLTGEWEKSDSKARYAGRLNPYKFTLRRRITNLLLFQHRWVVLKGQMQTDSDGCKITIETRPAAFLATIWVSNVMAVVLMVVMAFIESLWLTPIWLFPVFFLIILYKMLAQFAAGIIREKEFLQSVFMGERLWPEIE